MTFVLCYFIFVQFTILKITKIEQQSDGIYVFSHIIVYMVDWVWV